MNVSLGTNFGIANIIVPKGGPKTVPATLDFSNVASIDVDGQQIIDTGQIEYLQGVFIDNSDNAAALKITCHGTEQRIVCPPNAQGYFAILCTTPPRMTITTVQVNGLRIPVFFYNVPIQSAVWKTV